MVSSSLQMDWNPRKQDENSESFQVERRQNFLEHRGTARELPQGINRRAKMDLRFRREEGGPDLQESDNNF